MIFIIVMSVIVVGVSRASERHIYIGAIPFKDMKLNAPLLTSMKNTSRRQCGLRCLHVSGCRAFNYHVTDATCYLLGDYFCSESHDLITAPGFRYYDCEKDGDAQTISEARADRRCRTEGHCSPKCACHSLGVSTTASTYLTPDSDPEEEGEATPVWKDSVTSCLLACVSMPLPLCRSFNTMPTTGGVLCQLLPFLATERPASRLVRPSDWSHHRRKCFA
ncbi:uncharacterized protein LOC143285734 [Babylonia areolata]|uniref:uncharacterized protein LOC143285734 n=1 Tax=Babylonia areolata TaxID=304850 RepID=UPI003FCF5FC3